MPAHWTPSLWPTVAIPQRKKWHLPGGRITSGDLPLRTHARTHARTHTHTHTHKHAYYMTVCVQIHNRHSLLGTYTANILIDKFQETIT